jgi:hypothetical protein
MHVLDIDQETWCCLGVRRLLAQGVSLERVVYLDTGDEDDGQPELTEVGALQYSIIEEASLYIHHRSRCRDRGWRCGYFQLDPMGPRLNEGCAVCLGGGTQMRGMLGPRVVTVENDDRGIPAVFEDVLAKIGAPAAKGRQHCLLHGSFGAWKCTLPRIFEGGGKQAYEQAIGPSRFLPCRLTRACGALSQTMPPPPLPPKQQRPKRPRPLPPPPSPRPRGTAGT